MPAVHAPTLPPTVIVVLGAGRSGTSLLMQVLAALGLRVSKELIEANWDNPQGFFEDARIVRVHANLLRSLQAWPYLSLPTGWLDAPATHVAAGELQNVLHAHVHPGDQKSNPWGFKDPRTASFLPMWHQIFSNAGVTPRYILALREPASIIQSFMRAYGTSAGTAERVWLQRTCDAIWYTHADCHIVNYEDWFGRAREVIDDLARFTGLDTGLAETVTARLLPTLIRPALNRSSRPDHELRQPNARALHMALQACRGGAFDHECLLQTVAVCRANLSAQPMPDADD